jgi:hypothetical protein
MLNNSTLFKGNLLIAFCILTYAISLKLKLFGAIELKLN